MRTERMSAVILAGGKSSRMGKNKLLMPLGDKTVIGHLISTLANLFAETIVVTDEPDAYRPYPVKAVRDLICCPQKNSLTGIHAGLVRAVHSFVFVAAGDMPFISSELIKRLCGSADGSDVVIPREGSHFQPLCAVYHKNCLPHIEKLLYGGRYKILDFFPFVRVHYIDAVVLAEHDSELLSFFNVNTPDDYRRAQTIIGKSQKRSG